MHLVSSLASNSPVLNPDSIYLHDHGCHSTSLNLSFLISKIGIITILFLYTSYKIQRKCLA